MHVTEALESLASLLPSLPAESVEGLLVTFASLISNDADRPAAAQLLRDTAGVCQEPTRRDRLIRAADSIASGLPDTLSETEAEAKRAFEDQSVTEEEWNERIARLPLPPLPGESEGDEDDDDSNYMDEAPPKLPHLRVQDFFPGLVVRVGQHFADTHGRASCEGDLLTVLNCEKSYEGYAVTCLDRNLRLSDPVLFENAANAWFQPVPSIECLEALGESIDIALSEEEANEDYSDEDLDHIETIRGEMAECEDWLSRESPRGHAPKCRSSRLAAKIFGREHKLTVLIPFLCAAVGVATED